MASVDLPFLKEFITSHSLHLSSRELLGKGDVERYLRVNLNCLPMGSMIICKAFTGNNIQDYTYPYFDPMKSAAHALKVQPLNPTLVNSYSSVYRMREHDIHNKL